MQNQGCEFILAVFYTPAVEVGGFLIVAVEYLAENMRVAGVAESIVFRFNPLGGCLVVPQVGEVEGVSAVAAYGQIIVVSRLPAVFKFFEHASAAF